MRFLQAAVACSAGGLTVRPQPHLQSVIVPGERDRTAAANALPIVNGTPLPMTRRLSVGVSARSGSVASVTCPGGDGVSDWVNGNAPGFRVVSHNNPGRCAAVFATGRTPALPAAWGCTRPRCGVSTLFSVLPDCASVRDVRAFNVQEFGRGASRRALRL